jgi:hypothetical protein
MSNEIYELSSLNVPNLWNQNTKQDAMSDALFSDCMSGFRSKFGLLRLGFDDALHVLALAQDLINQTKLL